MGPNEGRGNHISCRPANPRGEVKTAFITRQVCLYLTIYTSISYSHCAFHCSACYNNHDDNTFTTDIRWRPFGSFPVCSPSDPEESVFLLPVALPSSLTLLFFHLLSLQPVHHPVHSAPSTPLSEGSMAHRHRNRQPWQVELAGSAAMHDTPCDRGMPTLWNQNEHCALTSSLSRVHGLLHSFQ